MIGMGVTLGLSGDRLVPVPAMPWPRSNLVNNVKSIWVQKNWSFLEWVDNYSKICNTWHCTTTAKSVIPGTVQLQQNLQYLALYNYSKICDTWHCTTTEKSVIPGTVQLQQNLWYLALYNYSKICDTWHCTTTVKSAIPGTVQLQQNLRYLALYIQENSLNQKLRIFHCSINQQQEQDE